MSSARDILDVGVSIESVEFFKLSAEVFDETSTAGALADSATPVIKNGGLEFVLNAADEVQEPGN
ncbi:MAG: hypothetical protein ACTII7_13220 [Galactobacter sp.]